MVLDEPKADDEIFKEAGISFTINKKLYEEVKPSSWNTSRRRGDRGIKLLRTCRNPAGLAAANFSFEFRVLSFEFLLSRRFF